VDDVRPRALEPVVCFPTARADLLGQDANVFLQTTHQSIAELGELARRVLRWATGSEIAARRAVPSNLRVLLLPCFHLLSDFRRPIGHDAVGTSVEDCVDVAL